MSTPLSLPGRAATRYLARLVVTEGSTWEELEAKALALPWEEPEAGQLDAGLAHREEGDRWPIDAAVRAAGIAPLSLEHYGRTPSPPAATEEGK